PTPQRRHSPFKGWHATGVPGGHHNWPALSKEDRTPFTLSRLSPESSGPRVITEIRVARGEHLLRSRLGAADPSVYSYNPARSPSPYQRRGDEAVTSSSPVCAAGFSSGWLEPPDENGGVLGGDDAGGLFIGDGKAADWPADVEGRRLGLEAERPGGDPLAVHEGPQLVGPADRQSREPVRQQIPPAIGQDGRPGGGRTLRRPQLDGRGGRVGEGGQCRPLQVIVGHGGLHPVEPMVLADDPHAEHGDGDRGHGGQPGQETQTAAGPPSERDDRRQFERGRRLLQGGGNAIPHIVGSRLVGHQKAGHFMIGREFALTGGAFAQVPLDAPIFVGIDSVESVGGEELFQFEMVVDHVPSNPASTKGSRRRRSPERIRLLIVPSGSPKRRATSR